jgi:hypothetical protein
MLRGKMKGKRLSKAKPEIPTSIFAFKAEKRKGAHDRGLKVGKGPLDHQDQPANLDLRDLPGRPDPRADKSWAWIQPSLC